MSRRDEWRVPDALFELLDEEFDFMIDVCATADTTRCARYYDKQNDGLNQTWAGTCWLHPPVSQLSRWMGMAVSAAYSCRATVVCLVPARTEAMWWQQYAMCGEMRFLPGTLHFGIGSGHQERAKEGYAVVVLRYGLPVSSISVRWWNWRRLAAEMAHRKQVAGWRSALNETFD